MTKAELLETITSIQADIDNLVETLPELETNVTECEKLLQMAEDAMDEAKEAWVIRDSDCYDAEWDLDGTREQIENLRNKMLELETTLADMEDE